MKLVTRISMLTLLALATMFVSTAKADTVTTYDVTGTFASGGTLSGTFTLDNLTVYSANIVADGQTLTCTGGSPCYTSTSGSFDTLDIPTGSYPFLQLDWLPFNYSAPPTTFGGKRLAQRQIFMRAPCRKLCGRKSRTRKSPAPPSCPSPANTSSANAA